MAVTGGGIGLKFARAAPIIIAKAFVAICFLTEVTIAIFPSAVVEQF